MLTFTPDALVTAIVSIALFLALCAALILVTVSLRKPANLPLGVAAALVVLCLMTVVVVPENAAPMFGVILAVLGVAVAVIGGDPMTRRILTIATRGQVREGTAGGILVFESRADADPQEVMRGGAVIGYLERLSVVVAIIAGYPEAIAVVVAVKGIGRFSELASAAARERFIVGTLASLLWACLVGALVRLALW
ncbi:hypothetical protein [Microbacterium sp. SORGH_AS_0888]|uniref:hypothetical protein n=1 Tax=Microbacterium sp. SORGH_AS_0888 TaxID=3041791 RepID=UPI0027844CBE|nr:hypothetical protein [Microbacterium sp. SORGH_AS_0888]MDQ1129032.1 hypothetical protein [Microbacterium sp. SORGH_AS_0888]